MTLDLAPGTKITLDGEPYVVEEHSSFHEVDFRLDLLHIVGRTPAHQRWLLAFLSEPYLMALERLEQDWLAAPRTSFVHAGEVFVALYRGAAQRVRRARAGRAKARMDYALYRADSGRVILTIGRNDEIQVWIGTTLPPGSIVLPPG